MTPDGGGRFSSEYVTRVAAVCGLLSHETRLRILLHLAQGEMSVTELCDLLELPQANVSHHLRILRDASLVRDRREGKYVMYGIEHGTWRGMANGFFEHLLEGEDTVRLQNILIERECDSEC